VAGRPDALEEEPVLQLATHLCSAERARALYLVSVALDGDDDVWVRQRLDALSDLVQEALAQPELTGRDTSNLVERRRAEAVRLTRDDQAAVVRIESSPRAYLLAQPPAAIAHQAALLDPVPGRGVVRVAVTSIADSAWRV